MYGNLIFQDNCPVRLDVDMDDLGYVYATVPSKDGIVYKTTLALKPGAFDRRVPE